MFPSPVVLLSILAITMAAIAFVATRNDGPAIREIDTVAKPGASSDPAPASADPHRRSRRPRSSSAARSTSRSSTTPASPDWPARPPRQATGAGWNVVGSDNWVGTVPGSTVYYPPRLKQAGKLLARDLGIDRLKPAVAPMRLDRLTVILTDDQS